MDKVRVGIIGLGYIGKAHLGNCLKLESAELVAVSDVSNKALNLAKRMGIKNVYGDYKMLLKDNSVSAVIIAVPTFLHLQCAKEAAEAGKHIFLEKPLARNVKEGKEIVTAAEKNSIKIMVGYPLRFSSSFIDLKDKIEVGELGEVQIAYATEIGPGPFHHRADGDVPRPVPEWWFDRESTGGGVLIDLGCHMINLLRWYFGEVSDVKSLMGYRFNLNLEDQATCLLKFQTRQTAIINVGWFSQENEIKIELYGTAGHAYAAHKPSSKVRTAIQLMTGRTPDFLKLHLKELSYFFECVKEGAQPSPSGEEALKDLQIIELAYRNQIHLD